MKSRLTIAFLVLALASAASGAGRGPIVRQVDRILIESAEPKALFAFFSTELQLPEAWPFSGNQGYMSGGLGAGNTTIEIYRYTRTGKDSEGKPATARFAGLALEPYPLAGALDELKTRGIPHSLPQPSVSTLPDGTKGVVWTTVPLPSFSKSGVSVFLFEYSQAFLKVDVRRKQLGNRLTLNNGGPLGIQSVREVVLTAADLKKEAAAWQRLLGTQIAPGKWSPGKGPSIKLAHSSRDRIQSIVIQVRSLAQAKTFLRKRNLLGVTSSTEISINPSGIQGLRIALVE